MFTLGKENFLLNKNTIRYSVAINKLISYEDRQILIKFKYIFRNHERMYHDSLNLYCNYSPLA